MESTAASNAARTDGSRPRVIVPDSLDQLLALDASALSALYAGASVPRISDVKGDLRGRMLTIPAFEHGAGKPIGRLAHTLASTSWFPWRGKSFTPLENDKGEGINRVISDRFRLYRFETFVGPSRAGAFDAVQLDYDLPENPFFIRAIKDEIRELSPGLYLGQAWLQIRGNTHLALYFGLTSK
jgi:hypothetical protein